MVRPLRFSRTLPKLPESFMFGVANSDHQCESYNSEVEDIADVWERTSSLPRRERATDFWHRYAEDVENARALGCTAFRFSIAWSRVEPTVGHYDDEAFEHYRDVVTIILKAGMEPIVTLLHNTWPVHVEERGGLISDDFPAIFARYAAEVASRVGKDIRYWITLNEPTLQYFGYLKLWWMPYYRLPPGLPPGTTFIEQMDAVGKLIRNLFLAHTAARTVIKGSNPDAQVGANPSGLGLPNWLQRWLDRHAIGLRGLEDLVFQGQHFVKRPLTELGKADMVVGTFTRTSARAEKIDFSDVYFVAGQMLLVKSDTTISSMQDLTDKVIAVVKSSTAESSIGRLIPTQRVLLVDDYPAALIALNQGKADAMVADDTILQGLLVQFPDKYKLLGERLTDEPYAVAIAQGNRELLDVVDIVIERFKKSGEWAASYVRNFPGQPVPDPPPSVGQSLIGISGTKLAQQARDLIVVSQMPWPLARPGTALRDIQNRGYLRVAVKEDVPGLGFRDPDTGAFSGLEIDLARAIAEQIFGDPQKIRFCPVTSQERIPFLHSLFHFLNPLLKVYSIYSTWLTSDWWYLGMAGKLSEFMCPQECVGQQDFIGIDYYWGISSIRISSIQRLVDALALGRLDLAPVWPRGLYELIKNLTRLFPGIPILVIENGSVDIADNIERPSYIRRHIREIQRAVRDGMNVKGYMYWSITTNREWATTFSKNSDFGLYHIDLDADPDLKRVETPAVTFYREIIAQHGV